VRHLLAGCEECRSTLQELKGARSLLSRLLDLPVASGDPGAVAESRSNYDWAFAKAERSLRSYPFQGPPSPQLPELLSELSGLSEGEQIRKVRAGGRFADPELVRVLIERANSFRYQSPRKTLHLSLLARLMADACGEGSTGGKELISDLQAEAWGVFANAQRIYGALSEAEGSFNIAFQRWKNGTGSARLEAGLLARLCSLRIFQRRFAEALDLAARAERIFGELGAQSQQAEALIRKGIALDYSGDSERAIDVLKGALPKIDREADPHLFLTAHHNLIRCYINLGRPDEALAIFYEARELYQSCQDPMILLRATWQEGQLLREIGHLRNSEAALLRARKGFEEQGLAYETAVVCLDLGEVYWKLGQLDQLRQTLAQAVPIFRSLRVEREVLAALLRLQQAAGMEEPSGPSE
jgi:pentatricopeptide repeat protein